MAVVPDAAESIKAEDILNTGTALKEESLKAEVVFHAESDDQKFSLIGPLETEALIRRLLEKSDRRPFVVAIDGPCGSGKTTLGQFLGQAFSTEVIQMDSFFLPFDLRTEERLKEPGGNVHYERFLQEVIPNLHDPQPFTYQAFSPHKREDNGPRKVLNGQIRIVEGSYAHHPVFGAYADLKIFTAIDARTQWERILQRNGKEWAEDFKNRWIPMENRYFEAFEIENQAQTIVWMK